MTDTRTLWRINNNLLDNQGEEKNFDYLNKCYENCQISHCDYIYYYSIILKNMGESEIAVKKIHTETNVHDMPRHLKILDDTLRNEIGAEFRHKNFLQGISARKSKTDIRTLRNRFEEEGYVIYPSVVSKDQICAIEKKYDKILEALNNVIDLFDRKAVVGLPLWVLCYEDTSDIEKLLVDRFSGKDNPVTSYLSPDEKKMLKDLIKNLVGRAGQDLIENIIGDNTLLTAERSVVRANMAKIGGNTDQFPPLKCHADGTLHRIFSNYATAFLLINNENAISGGLSVIPHNFQGRMFIIGDDFEVPDHLIITPNIEEGDLWLHDSQTLHFSAAPKRENPGTGPRYSIDVRFWGDISRHLCGASISN